MTRPQQTAHRQHSRRLQASVGHGITVSETISRLARALDRAQRLELRGFGLSPSQVQVLNAVGHNPGSTSADLARHLTFTHQNVSKLVSGLAESALLSYEPSSSSAFNDCDSSSAGRQLYDVAARQVDRKAAGTRGRRPMPSGEHRSESGRRGTVIELTEQGRFVLEQASSRLAELEAAALSGFSPTGRTQLASQLDKLLRHLGEADSQAERVPHLTRVPPRTTYSSALPRGHG